MVSVPVENHNTYIYPMKLSCQHVMKASPFITAHYRNNICTITAVQTTLVYVIETTYSGGTAKCGGMNSDRHTLRRTIYSQCSQPLLEKQRSVRITDRKAKLPQLAEDPYLLTSRSKVSLQKVKLSCT
jgi:hypothetical protein